MIPIKDKYSLSLVNTLSCKYNYYFPHISWFVLLLLLLVFTNQNTTLPILDLNPKDMVCLYSTPGVFDA